MSQQKLQPLLEALAEDPSIQLPDPNLLAQELENNRQQTALSIRIFSTLGAWLSALLFTAFLFISHIITSQSGATVVGGLLILLSIVISHASHKKPILDPFTLAFGILGQILFGVGMSETMNNQNSLFMTGILVETAILIFSKHQVQRFGSTLLILLSITGLIFENSDGQGFPLLPALALVGFAFLWMKEAAIISRLGKLSDRWQPTTLALGVFGMFYYFLSVSGHDWTLDSIWWMLSSIPLIVAILWVGREVLIQTSFKGNPFVIGGVGALVLLPLIFTPGILAGILVLLVGFSRGNNKIAGLGLFGLAVYIIAFYYNLETTLLVKSMCLLASSTVFLLARVALKRYKSLL